MSTESSDSASASSARFVQGLARGLGIASIGSGMVLHELMAISNCRSKCSADGLFIRHPLVFSNICDVSSKHLWSLHEQLLTMLVSLHKEKAPMKKHLVTAARLDTWILIDLVLKERSESRMAEPPSEAGFRFEEESSDYFSADHGHELQAGVTRSHNSSVLFAKDALQRSLRDTVTLQKRKRAHFLQLAERNSETDSDVETELPPARRLQILSRREDRRMARLIRECPHSSTPIAKSPSKNATAPMTDFVMSGALSPGCSEGFMADKPAFPNQRAVKETRAEQPNPIISKPLPPDPKQSTTPSTNSEEEQQQITIPKPTQRTTRASLRNFSSKTLFRSRYSLFSLSRPGRKNTRT